MTPRRPVALVTGASRAAGIGAACAIELARLGWDVATTSWVPYDERMPWGADADGAASIKAGVRAHGGRWLSVPADLADARAAASIFPAVEAGLGPISALVLAHCESVDSDILGTTVESFERHMDVNARASWLLIRELAVRFAGESGTGRIVALTSDHTAGNLPYGASKGALDRIVIAAARELAHLGITANVINPGPTDTGWMSAEQLDRVAARTPRGRVGQPSDAAALVGWLCSAEGGWVNGQLLHSDGGINA